MSDKIKGYIIALESDVNEEDAVLMQDAFLMMKNVIGVTPILTEADDWLNRAQIEFEIRDKLYDFINKELKH